MTLGARGLYITLLCYAWHEDPPGSIPASLIETIAAGSLSDREVNSVRSCFTEIGDRLVQKRLTKEAEKSQKLQLSRSSGAQKTNINRWGNRSALAKRSDSDNGASRSRSLYHSHSHSSDITNKTIEREGVQGEKSLQEDFRLIGAEAAPSQAARSKKVSGSRKPILMSKESLAELAANPAYQGLDVRKEAWKFKNWCEQKRKPTTVARFVNWLNRVT